MKKRRVSISHHGDDGDRGEKIRGEMKESWKVKVPKEKGRKLKPEASHLAAVNLPRSALILDMRNKFVEITRRNNSFDAIFVAKKLHSGSEKRSSGF